MKNRSVHRLAFSAVIAAGYAALTMATGFMSYGGVQFRIAEALCVLPFFFPYTAWGLFVGCLLANLISPAGALDVVFGSLATLGSCLCVVRLGKRGQGWRQQIAACLMPVVLNAVVVGAVLTVTSADAANSAPLWLFFAVYAGEIALGEAAVLFALGLPLLRWLPRSSWMSRLDLR